MVCSGYYKSMFDSCLVMKKEYILHGYVFPLEGVVIISYFATRFSSFQITVHTLRKYSKEWKFVTYICNSTVYLVQIHSYTDTSPPPPTHFASLFLHCYINHNLCALRVAILSLCEYIHIRFHTLNLPASPLSTTLSQHPPILPSSQPQRIICHPSLVIVWISQV